MSKQLWLVVSLISTLITLAFQIAEQPSPYHTGLIAIIAFCAGGMTVQLWRDRRRSARPSRSVRRSGLHRRYDDGRRPAPGPTTRFRCSRGGRTSRPKLPRD